MSQGNDFRWRIGEELIYKVKWSFIRLGTINVRIADTTRINNQQVYKIEMNIDSSPLIFFVNIHNYYETYIDENYRLHLHVANERMDNKPFRSRHEFNYSDSTYKLIMTDKKDSTQTINKIMPFKTNMYDGISLAFFARGNVHKKHVDTLCTFVMDTVGLVDVELMGKADAIGIDAIPQKVPSYFVKGMIHVKGLAGLTGPYRGWFSADDRRVPLKAELKVFIGNVKVELEDWKNWRPQFNN